MFHRHGYRFFGLKRHLAGEHFVKHHPQAVNISATVYGLATGLFRAHVVGRAHHGAGIGHTRGAAYGFSDSKIRHHGGAVFAKQDVLGLYVPMDIAFLLGMIMRFGQFAGYTHRFLVAEYTGHMLMYLTTV